MHACERMTWRHDDYSEVTRLLAMIFVISDASNCCMLNARVCVLVCLLAPITLIADRPQHAATPEHMGSIQSHTNERATKFRLQMDPEMSAAPPPPGSKKLGIQRVGRVSSDSSPV